MTHQSLAACAFAALFVGAAPAQIIASAGFKMIGGAVSAANVQDI